MQRLSTLTFCIQLLFCPFIDIIADRKVPMNFINKAIEGHDMQTVVEMTFSRCANRCMHSADCMSIGFNINTKHCMMYLINSSKASGEHYLKDEKNTVVMDISNWIQGKTGGCWDRPCPPHTFCASNKNSTVCIPYGCRVPEHVEILYKDAQFVGVGSKIDVRCIPRYIAVLADQKSYLKVTCNVNEQWNRPFICYEVSEVCKFYFLERNIHNANIMVRSMSGTMTQILSPVLPSSYTDVYFFQVSFPTSIIGGIVTKWITGFTLQIGYSYDCDSLYDVENPDGSIKKFPGYTDDNNGMKVYNHFERALFVACFVLYPNERLLWVELLECRL